MSVESFQRSTSQSQDSTGWVATKQLIVVSLSSLLEGSTVEAVAAVVLSLSSLVEGGFGSADVAVASSVHLHIGI